MPWATSEATIRSRVLTAGTMTLPSRAGDLPPGDQELGDAAAFDGTLADPVAKVGFGRTVEAPDAQIAADALRLRTFGGIPAGPVEQQHWGQIELTRQVIDDAQRRLAVVIEKPAVGAQHAQL